MNTTHIHPFIVHFSISLVVVGAVLDFYSIIIKGESWPKAKGFQIMIFAAFAIFFSWFSGEFFSRSYDGLGREVKNLHEVFAVLSYVFFGIALLIRFFAIYKKDSSSLLKYIFMIFLALAVIAILYCGYLGGVLVYDLQNDLRPVQ
jgi:uncharacterized membrane protein